MLSKLEETGKWLVGIKRMLSSFLLSSWFDSKGFGVCKEEKNKPKSNYNGNTEERGGVKLMQPYNWCMCMVMNRNNCEFYHKKCWRNNLDCWNIPLIKMLVHHWPSFCTGCHHMVTSILLQRRDWKNYNVYALSQKTKNWTVEWVIPCYIALILVNYPLLHFLTDFPKFAWLIGE